MVVLKTSQLQRSILLVLIWLLTSGVLSGAALASPIIGERFERTLGGSAASTLVKQYGGEHALPIAKRMWVDEVFRRLVEVTTRQDVEYTLTVLNSSELNAFALPGGYVFITRGLVNSIGDDEGQLAAVLAHEIAHVEQKHGVNAVLRQMGLTVLLEVGAIAFDFATSDLWRVASATLVQLVNLGWGREAEYEADALGQTLAFQAGFDPVSAVSILDALFKLDSKDLPMKVFRTHPDTKNRRDRLEKRLISFWSTPALVTDLPTLESLDMGRNSYQDGRSDPNDRYVVTIPMEGTGLEVFDQQTEDTLTWLENTKVSHFAWSPQGQYVAISSPEEFQTKALICDRYGYIIKSVTLIDQTITSLNWSPLGNMLAIDVHGSGTDQVMVMYIEADVMLSVSGEHLGSSSLWQDNVLYFRHEQEWYYTVAPIVQPVTVPNPVPQVLQRQRILSPTVIKEGNTTRLTRPSLTLP